MSASSSAALHIPTANELLMKHHKEYKRIQYAIATLDEQISDGHGIHHWCAVGYVTDFTPKMLKYIKSLGYETEEYSHYMEDSDTTEYGIQIRIPPQNSKYLFM